MGMQTETEFDLTRGYSEKPIPLPRHALLLMAYCLGVWTATALGYTYVFAPRTARFVGAVFTMVGLADFLNRAYYATKSLD